MAGLENPETKKNSTSGYFYRNKETYMRKTEIGTTSPVYQFSLLSCVRSKTGADLQSFDLFRVPQGWSRLVYDWLFNGLHVSNEVASLRDF